MNNFKKRLHQTILLTFLFTFSYQLHADEGMWIPLLLKDQKIDEMHAKGFQLSAEDIFSMNQSSLKDAIVKFGGGCTGEVISNQGLLITNHHCGYSNIQSHSSIENDYLTDGFWAMSLEEELTNPGLKVQFLEKIVDVTDLIHDGITPGMSESETNAIVHFTSQQIIEDEINTSEFKNAAIHDFFEGKQYLLFVYNVFTDVRLVGAPPSAIGKFGGDTDNWMWPRHTGDFSIFRIYADQDNNPANYSPENIPYTPGKYLPISLKGYNAGDFTMVYGYPGSTNRYLTSHAVKYMVNKELPDNIDARDIRLEIMAEAMEDNPAVRIQYASKYARVSNAWKKWQGMIRGLEKYEAIEKKISTEEKFQQWAAGSAENRNQFGNLLNEFDSIYAIYETYHTPYNAFFEIIYGSEILKFSAGFSYMVRLYLNGEEERAGKIRDRLKSQTHSFYKNYYPAIEQEVMPRMLEMYLQRINAEFLPVSLIEAARKYDGDMDEFSERLWKKSFLSGKDEILSVLTSMDEKEARKISKDPIIMLYNDFLSVMETNVLPKYRIIRQDIDSLYSVYMDGLLTMYPDSIFAADANGTLRVAFGNIGGYTPLDAVNYDYYTTLAGVIEKVDPNIYDYNVPQKLIDLFHAKSYGSYAQEGEMRVCFVASNHTSGGNSGSPVLDAEGNLIGVNFDRNWEGTMSDVMFDPSQCRNISLDIRYALFIIDKFAGATYLIDEMDLIY